MPFRCHRGRQHLPGDGQRRLQAQHPRGRLVEGDVLGFGRMRGVIGGDGIDRPVAQTVDDRGHVTVRAQRRVDLEHRVVAGHLGVGEQHVMRRRLRGDR